MSDDGTGGRKAYRWVLWAGHSPDASIARLKEEHGLPGAANDPRRQKSRRPVSLCSHPPPSAVGARRSALAFLHVVTILRAFLNVPVINVLHTSLQAETLKPHGHLHTSSCCCIGRSCACTPSGSTSQPEHAAEPQFALQACVG